MKFISAIFAFVFSFSAFANNDYFKNDQVEVFVHPTHLSYAVNSDDYLALTFKMQPDWHIYWINPGDSGAAPKWTWTSDILKVSEVLFPAPERIEVEGLFNFGYSNSVTFPVKFVSGPTPGKGKVSVDLEWLACKIECVPGFANLATEVTLAEFRQGPTAAQQQVEQALAMIPKSESTLSATLGESNSEFVEYQFDAESSFDQIKSVEIFPFDSLYFKNSPPEISLNNYSILVRAYRQTNSQQLNDPRVLAVFKTEQGSRVAQVQLIQEPTKSLISLLLLALLGGIILNAMP